MPYTPLTVEPTYVRMTGFTYAFAGSNVKYVIRFGRTVSYGAKNAILDSIDLVDPITPGWNHATADNVTGVTAGNLLLQQPAFGEDAEIMFFVDGVGGDGNAVTIDLDARSAVPPTVDLMVVHMAGDLFESNDSADYDRQFWYGLQMVGKALGLGEASNDLDVMYPVYRGDLVDVDSLGQNISISQCDIDAVQGVLPAGPPVAAAVACGGEPLPAVVPIPGAVAVTLGRTIYAGGEVVGISTHTTDLVAADLEGARVTCTITNSVSGAVVFEGVGISDVGGLVDYRAGIGRTPGNYDVQVVAEIAGFRVEDTSATVELV